MLYRLGKSKSGSSRCSAEDLVPRGSAPSPGVRTCCGERAGCVIGGEGDEPGAVLPLAWCVLTAFPLTSDGDKTFPKVLPDLYVKLLHKSEKLLLGEGTVPKITVF